MSDRATKILGDAGRRTRAAQRAAVGARVAVNAQEALVARLKADGVDLSHAEMLLGHLRALLSRRTEDLQRLTAEQAELLETPRWRLNDG